MEQLFETVTMEMKEHKVSKRKGFSIFLRKVNILLAILYMVIYTTPYFRFYFGSQFRLFGLGLLLMWFLVTLFVYGIRFVSPFVFAILLHVIAFILMAAGGLGNIRDIISGYVAFWSFLFIFDIYLQNRDYEAIRTITIVLLVVICITGITTIVASIAYPNISKNTYKDDMTGNSIANQLNVGGFDYIAGMSILVPALMFFAFRKKKKIFLVPLILCLIATVESGYAIDFLVLCFGIIAYFVADRNCRLTPTRTLLLVIALWAALIIVRESVMLLSYVGSGNEHLASRLQELRDMLNGDLADGTDLAYRIELYLRSFNSFLDNPLTGVGPYYYEGGHGLGNHSQILDDMGRFGLASIIVYGIVIYYFIFWMKKLKYLSGEHFSLEISYFAFIVLSFVNPTLILPVLGLVLLFILPGLYFIK